MKIKGKETRHIDLEVDPKEVIQLTINMVLGELGLREEYYLNKDKTIILKDKEYAGSHRWTETEGVRNATDEDLKAFEIAQYLRGLKASK